jgi:hypothetical protein
MRKRQRKKNWKKACERSGIVFREQQIPNMPRRGIPMLAQVIRELQMIHEFVRAADRRRVVNYMLHELWKKNQETVQGPGIGVVTDGDS